MKKYLFLLLSLSLSTTISSQTDVTRDYLTNAGFDDSSSWQTSDIVTKSDPNSFNVTGWTIEQSAAWSTSGAFGYGSSAKLNSVAVPSQGPDGSTTGGALGISTGWGGSCQYSQTVTLPAGRYRISYKAYNNLPNVTQSTNLIGFIPTGGTPQYSTVNNFPYQTWIEDGVIVDLSAATQGKICVGLQAVSGGSGDNAKVFIDYVKIESYSNTPVVYNGTYFLMADDGRYLARGNDWGTRAILDEWGLPVIIATDGDNNTTVKFGDSQIYLYDIDNSAYTDYGSVEKKSQWEFILQDGNYLLSSKQHTGEYVGCDANGSLVTNASAATAVKWQLQTPADHATAMAALRAEASALAAETQDLVSKTYLTASPTATAEQYQGSGEVMTGEIAIPMPGIYKFSIQAFNRMASNEVTYPLHLSQADCPPVYVYFGDKKVQIHSVFDEATTSDTGWSTDGKNYPNGEPGALVSFQEGHYVNTIYVRVGTNETGTWHYGIMNQGKAKENAHWTCYAPDGIEVTRYYDPETDGLDEEDQQKADLIESLTLLLGDVDYNKKITVTDAMLLVDIILKTTKDYDLEIADVSGDGKVTVTDVMMVVDVILGYSEAKTVDRTYTYADVKGQVYAEQQNAENTNGAAYVLQSAVGSLTGQDVSAKYDITDYLTTLRVDVGINTADRVSIYAIDKTPIAGPMDIKVEGENTSASYAAGNASTYTASQQSDVVTVCGSGAGTYTAYLLPQTLNSGVMVTVRTTDGKYYSQTFTNILPGKENQLTFTATEASNLWMSTLPGNTYFSMLSTPGAHDACTSSVSSSSGKCQSEDLSALLANGVRAFDLRPRYTSNSQSDITLDNLTIYHGMLSTGVKFKDAIDILVNFVKAHPSEAVSVIMQKENSKALISLTDQSETWRASMRECFGDANRSPYIMKDVKSFHTLDSVRGKVSIVSKNPYGNESNGYRDVVYGAIIENWPDDGVVTDFSCNMTQAWNGVDCHASVEDAYNSSTNTKQSQVETQLTLASNNTNASRYVYTFTSIANSPASYANTMNPATTSIIQRLNGPLCYVYADYMGSSSNGGAALLKAVIDQNLKYVFRNSSYKSTQ